MTQMKISKKYFEKLFKSPDPKEAYLKACKWLANNILNKNELNESYYNISKVEQSDDITVFKLELYCMLESTEVTNRFCNTCKESHRSFYRNSKPNCFSCNMITYKDRLTESINIKSSYRKQKIEFLMEKKKQD